MYNISVLKKNAKFGSRSQNRVTINHRQSVDAHGKTILATNGSSNNSPFDSIRRTDERGNEYWLARDLAAMLGYAQWRNFVRAIEEAIENIELTGESASDHIAASSNVVERSQGGGSDKEDYNLTRYGAYMTTLACDGRGKPMVALAKKYFAVKTREAELGQSRQLPQSDARIFDYVQCQKDIETISHPVIKSLLEQRLMEELTNTNLLVGGTKQETYVILTVRAKELGYTDKQIGGGQALGNFVVLYHQPVGKIQHGKYPVNTYLMCDGLDATIRRYFAKRGK